MNTTIPSEDDHRARSHFVRKLVQRPRVDDRVTVEFSLKPPRKIVQFWDNPESLPADVRDCIESWRPVEERGIELTLFDHNEASNFIARRLGPRHLAAYGKCYHPAMQSDYFRLCYLLVEGGCYVDADDIYHGHPIEHLFEDGRLKIQPLCYDASTGEMVHPKLFKERAANEATWIFYFNNNPLIAMREHPIIRRALMAATENLERPSSDELPEIQSTTGPGNLTKSIFDHATQRGNVADTLLVLHHWEDVAISKWPLSYRRDARNWRLSNERRHRGLATGSSEGDQK